MVEEPTTLTRPPRRHRTKPSRNRILIRRGVAVGFVLGLVALLVGSAMAVLGGGEEAAAPPPAPPPPKTCNIAFPEGFTREQMAAKVTANARAAQQECGFASRLSESRYLALTDGASRVPPAVSDRGSAAESRGLPVPSHLRVHGEDEDPPDGQLTACGLREELGEGQPALRAVEEPDAIRRPDHRVDDREGGHRARGATARRRGDLQPPQGRHDAGDRRDASVRPRHSAHGVDPASRSSTRTTRTTLESFPG